MATSPECSAAWRAFRMALPAKVVSVSSGSGIESAPADTRLKRASSRAASSTALPGLWVAATSLSPLGSVNAMPCPACVPIAADFLRVCDPGCKSGRICAIKSIVRCNKETTKNLIVFR